MTQSKIRICFVSPKAYPLFNPTAGQTFGGAEVDCFMIATELAKDDRFSVSLVVADYGQPNEQVRQNVRLLKSLRFGQNPLTGMCKISRALKQADADIYLIKTASPGVPLVQHFCKHHHRKFVYRTAHQDECDGVYCREHPLIGSFFIRSLKQADCVFAQNQTDADRLKQRYQIDAVVVANAHRICENSETNRKSVLWVGRSTAFKQPDYFLELARAFPNQPFIMICPKATDDSQYATLAQDARKIPNLEFVEGVAFAEIDRYFQEAKVFVNTSRAEGFPNTFIQACKCGTAILSYAVNPDGFLDSCQCGICCDGQKEQLVERLKELLDGKRFWELGRSGIDYVRRVHDITQVIELYKNRFLKLMGR